MIKLMTLNLWCYFDWDARKDNIVRLIQSESPDIIALQEVQVNTAFSATPQSQYIAQHAGYQHHLFVPTWFITDNMPWDENIKTRQSHGLAIISRYPIAAHEGYALKQHPDHDEKSAILFVTIAIRDKTVDICNVHFGNSDLFSDLHVKECMAVCAHKGVSPIIMGDFNNFRLQDYSTSQLKDYTISTEVAPYISMPKNEGTLDYIATLFSMRMSDVRCPSTYVSDHRPVLANITF